MSRGVVWPLASCAASRSVDTARTSTASWRNSVGRIFLEYEHRRRAGTADFEGIGGSASRNEAQRQDYSTIALMRPWRTAFTNVL